MNNSLKLVFALSFLFGLGQNVDIDMVGRITIADFIVWMGMPYYLFMTRNLLLAKRGKIALTVLAFYLVSLLVSNWIVGNYSALIVRGFLRVFFIGGYMVFFLWMLQASPKALWALLLGVALGSPIVLIRPGEWMEEIVAQGGYGAWSGVYGQILVHFCILLACFLYRRRPLLSFILLLVTFAVMSPFVPRSKTLVGLMSAGIVLYLIFCHFPNRRAPQTLTASSFVLYSVFGLLALSLMYGAYIYMAPAGYLGEYQQKKFFDQTSTAWGKSPWGLVLSGRTEFVAALLAVGDHPLVGMGSWNSENWATYMEDALRLSEDKISSAELASLYYSYYSHHATFLGEWAEAGIGAMFFWLFTIYCGFKVFASLVRHDNVFAPYYCFTIALFGWNLMFSPLNISIRLAAGMILATYLMLYVPGSRLYPVPWEWVPKRILDRFNKKNAPPG